MLTQNRFDLISALFFGKKILIVGDVMLDRHYYGKTDRMSPEAPVPVVDIDSVVDSPGGSSNVALNLSMLGASATICGMVGDDLEGEILIEKLTENNILTNHIMVDQNRPTTVKSRIISKDHHVVRMDREITDDAPKKLNDLIIKSLSKELSNFDAVILQDYNKGLLNSQTIPKLIEIANNLEKPIYVDPKHRNFDLYTNIRFLKPNISEFRNFLPEVSSFENDAFSFFNQINTDILMITKGADGASLFFGDEHYSIPTKAQHVHDVSGAGDTVISSFCLSDICGATPKESAYISNFAAGRVCEEVGVVPISIKMLSEINRYIEK
jgi:rfaE bifunctional protein kinase chain/domain